MSIPSAEMARPCPQLGESPSHYKQEGDSPVPVPVPGGGTPGRSTGVEECGGGGLGRGTGGGGSAVPPREKRGHGVVRERGDSGRKESRDPVIGQRGHPPEERGREYRGRYRGRGLGVTFQDNLPPGSLQRLDGLIVGGISEIDAVNGENSVAQPESPAPFRRQPGEDP